MDQQQLNKLMCQATLVTRSLKLLICSSAQSEDVMLITLMLGNFVLYLGSLNYKELELKVWK